MENNTKIFKYIAAACFCLLALFQLLDFANGVSVSLLTVMDLAGLVLIALSLFISLPVLRAVGGALCAFPSLRSLVMYLGKDYIDWIPKGLLLAFFLVFVFYILILISGIEPKLTKTLCTAAGAAAALRLLVVLILAITLDDLHLSASNVLDGVIMVLGGLMLGFSTAEIHASPAPSRAVVSPPPAHTANAADDRITRLTKLKQLLDSGIISQEEFDAKKKQILAQKGETAE